jgi:hypothetical protein
MPNPKPTPRTPSLDPLIYVAHAVVNEKTDHAIRLLCRVLEAGRSQVIRRALRIGLRQLKQDIAGGMTTASVVRFGETDVYLKTEQDKPTPHRKTVKKDT